MTLRRSTFVCATALATLAALTSAPARAALPAPGCAGLAFSDPAGDVSDAAGPMATNLDVTDGYFITEAAGKVSATMKVADMSLTPPPPATAVSWYMKWTVKEVTYYVSLEADIQGAQVFETGTYGPNAAGTGTSYQPTGTTKGSVTEGPDGGITFEVPKAAQGVVGKVLTQPAGESFQLVQNGLGGGVLLFGDDTDPEGGSSYDVGKCEGFGSAPAAPVTVTAPPAPIGAPIPAPTADTPQPAPVLPLTLASKSVKAKKGVLTLKLKASDAVTQVSARLRKGTKALGTGKAASIGKGATRSLKLKARKAKKGTYVLDVTARLADGRLASAAFALKVK